MYKNFRFRAVISQIRHPAFLLTVFSGAGLILATTFAATAKISSVTLMRLVSDSRLSIVCHLASQLLPFLIAAFAVNISRRWLIYTVCFLRLFFFSYIGSLFWIAFGSAGWLIRWLVLFSDIILVPALLWFCFRGIFENARNHVRDFWICISAVILTALINWLLISPLLVRIIDI